MLGYLTIQKPLAIRPAAISKLKAEPLRAEEIENTTIEEGYDKDENDASSAAGTVSTFQRINASTCRASAAI
jgi:hypothetical protein